jgi:hypothetical protein
MPTYIDRYLAGERVAVWNELIALGEAVYRKPVQADANAVAEETMRRARRNIEVLIPRLSGMGYRFAAPAIERELERTERRIREPKINPITLRQLEKAVAEGKMPASALDPRQRPGFQQWMATLQEQKADLEAELERMAMMPPLENPKIFYSPEAQTTRSLKAIEKQTNGPLPLSLRSWYRQVGYVSFAGSHPVLSPAGSATADPLVVRPAAEIMIGVPIPGDDTEVSVAAIFEELECARQNGKQVLTISESDRSKAGLQGGKQCKIWLPEPSVDVELRNLWRPMTFVAYLRSAFEWGGFPGWERDPSPPREAIGELTEGLLPL